MNVTFLAAGATDRTLTYQRYYWLGLTRTARLRLAELPPFLRSLPGHDRKVRVSARLDGSRLIGAGKERGFVGRYVAEVEGRRVPFVIDARDNHAIQDPDALEWSDVYFKANRWTGEHYESKVEPIVNGNGLLDWRRIEQLRGMRTQPKNRDVAFISNLWGGREHNVRLFEELARSDFDCDLLAVLPPGADPAEDAEFERRLKAVGVPCSREQIPPTVLWNRLAQARVVVFRSGKHLCIPWRMLDLLAMGACVAFDATPLPQWPVPIRDGEHYHGIGIHRPAYSPPSEEEYAKVVPALRRLVEDDALAAGYRDRAAAYFDDQAAPERVAEYVLRVVEAAGCR